MVAMVVVDGGEVSGSVLNKFVILAPELSVASEDVSRLVIVVTGGKAVVGEAVVVSVSTPHNLQDFLQFSDIQTSDPKHCPINAQLSHMVSLPYTFLQISEMGKDTYIANRHFNVII